MKKEIIITSILLVTVITLVSNLNFEIKVTRE